MTAPAAGPGSASRTAVRAGLGANLSAAVAALRSLPSAAGFAAVVAGVVLVNWPSPT